LSRVETGEISRDLDQGVVVQKFDGAAHDAVAARTGLVGLELDVKISRALAGEVGNAVGHADAVDAVTADAGGFGKVLTVGNLLDVQ